MKALELHCGIGGFAAAAEELPIDVVGALDVSSHVVEAYNANFEPLAEQRNLLSMDPDDFAEYGADLWWMSPPCAPYTRRGNKRDLEDRRAASFLRVVEAIRVVRPPAVALENVEGFSDSRARELLVETLQGYDVLERIICPTELGIPNKRPRYYLVASQTELKPVSPSGSQLADWRSYVGDVDDERYVVPERVVDKYGAGFHVTDETETYTTCFTGSYGKSWNFTGSYLSLPNGRIRQFTPAEVLRFLHFPSRFRFPPEFTDRQCWKYGGNSLSIVATREALRPL